MSDELFWTMFGAIGTTVGSLATAAAVIVALWQTKFSNRKKLKIKFDDPITLVNPNTGETMGHFVGVTIINIGNREVIINDWSIICNNKNRYKIMTEMQGLMKKSLPARLPLEESLSLSYEREFFVRIVREMIVKKEIKPNQKVKFQISDTTGQKHIVYSKSVASDYVKESTE